MINNKDNTNQMHAACSKLVGSNPTFGKSFGTAYMYGHGAKVGLKFRLRLMTNVKDAKLPDTRSTSKLKWKKTSRHKVPRKKYTVM